MARGNAIAAQQIARIGTACGRRFRRRQMAGLYDSAAEEAAHEEAIEALVNETCLPAHAVRTVYEREYARLKPDARIRDFLLLFTIRRARETLLRSGG
jgi:hypothetical protein